MPDWIDDGHKLRILLWPGNHCYLQMICPGSPTCQAIHSCDNCEGRGDGCEDCDETGTKDKWTSCAALEFWENADPAEYMAGEGDQSLDGLTLPLAIVYRWIDDGPLWKLKKVPGV